MNTWQVFDPPPILSSYLSICGLTGLQMTWYVLFESILNLLAELTYFADRGFYVSDTTISPSHSSCSLSSGYLLPPFIPSFPPLSFGFSRSCCGISTNISSGRLVELHILGPICAGLESASAQFSPASCLPFFNLFTASKKIYGDPDHLFLERSKITYIQEIPFFLTSYRSWCMNWLCGCYLSR